MKLVSTFVGSLLGLVVAVTAVRAQQPPDVDGTWSTDYALSGLSGGPVRATAVYRDALILGGSFNRADGVPCPGLIRWKDEQWTAFDSEVAGVFTTLLVVNDELYVGGQFHFPPNAGDNHIARWDGQRWQVMDAGIPWRMPIAIVEYQGSIYVATDWSVHRWMETRWELIPTPPGFIGALHAASDGLYVGGLFDDFEEGDYCLLRLDGTAFVPEGRAGDSWGRFSQHRTRCLASHDGALVIGGDYVYPDGVVRSYAAQRRNGGWSHMRGLAFDSEEPTLLCFASAGNELYAGGSFPGTIDDPTSAHIARWDGQRWRSLSSGIRPRFAVWPEGEVLTLAEFHGELIVGGNFEVAGDASCSNIARWDGTRFRTMTRSGAGVGFGSVTALARFRGQLVVASNYFFDNEVLATWNGEAWVGLGGGVNGPVHTLCVYGNDLYAGGNFTRAGGTPCRRVARWDGQRWHALDEGVGPQGSVLALLPYRGLLIVAGVFYQAGQHFVQNLAAWDGTRWHPYGLGLPSTTETRINALAEVDGTLYAGGLLYHEADRSIRSLARLNGESWKIVHEFRHGAITEMVRYDDLLALGYASGCGPGSESPTPVDLGDLQVLPVCDSEALVMHQGYLYAGGPDDERNSDVRRWDGVRWENLANANGKILSLASEAEGLLAGGDFSKLDGVVSHRLGRWIENAPVVILDRLDTEWNERGMLVSWKTSAERGRGFNLYRQVDDEPEVKLNDSLIESRGAAGSTYELWDLVEAPAIAITYELEFVENDGTELWLGSWDTSAPEPPNPPVDEGPSSSGSLDLEAIGRSPTTGEVRVQFAIPGSAWGDLSLLDGSGRKRASLRPHLTGMGNVELDLRSEVSQLPSGVYWLRLMTPTQSRSVRIVFLE